MVKTIKIKNRNKKVNRDLKTVNIEKTINETRNMVNTIKIKIRNKRVNRDLKTINIEKTMKDPRFKN